MRKAGRQVRPYVGAGINDTMTEICCGQSRPPLRLDFVTMAVVELGTVRGTGVGGGGGEREMKMLSSEP